MQNKLAERSCERREETMRAWLESPRLDAIVRRFRKEALKEDLPLVAAE